jgi:MFS family permease
MNDEMGTERSRGPLVNGRAGITPAAGLDETGRVSRGLALLFAGALFMEILDGTVIAPAAPHIASDFGVNAVAINVAINVAITLAVLIPISGWLADRFGPRRVFMTAVAIFTVASAGCALAMNLPMLTTTRVLQGMGGAMTVPVGRLVVLHATAKRDLVKVIAYRTWPALVAPVVTPALGGVLSTYASWRWIFVINVPMGLAALPLAHRLVPHVRTPNVARLDWRGFALTATGVGALMVGIENIGKPTPVRAVGVIGLTAAAAALTAAVLYLLRVPRPLLDLRILRIRTYRVTALGGSAFRAVISATPFLLALFFQLGFGWTAARAGLVVVALFSGNVAIKPATTSLMRRLGIRSVLLGADRGLGLLPSRDGLPSAHHTLTAAARAAGAQRNLPVDRIHCLQQRRLRRCPARADDPRQHPDVNGPGAWNRTRRRDRSAAGEPWRQPRPWHRRRRAVPRRVRHARGHPCLACDRGADAPSNGREQGHRPGMTA